MQPRNQCNQCATSQLIADAESITARTGWGLAHTWGLIRTGRIDAARARLAVLERMLP